MNFKNQYLARCTKWLWYDEGTIGVFTKENAATSTKLTKWQTLVFHAADGNTSLNELIGQLNDGISNKANEDFTNDLVKATIELKELKVIEYWSKKDDLLSLYEEASNE